MQFLKGFIFFILFIPMLLLVFISHFIHPHMEKTIEKAQGNLWYVPLVILLIPIFIPITIVLNQTYNWWDGLGE